MGPVVYRTGAEAVAKVLVVLVVGIWLLRVDAALRISLRIDSKGALLFGSESRGTAVAGEVALLEDLDELMFAMALDGA